MTGIQLGSRPVLDGEEAPPPHAWYAALARGPPLLTPECLDVDPEPSEHRAHDLWTHFAAHVVTRDGEGRPPGASWDLRLQQNEVTSVLADLNDAVLLQPREDLTAGQALLTLRHRWA